MKLYGPGEAAPNARRILAALGRHGVDYLLIGGFAVNAHGYPRLTRDVDILVPLDKENFARLAEAIADLGSDDELAPATWRSGDATRFDTHQGVLRVHRSIDGLRAGYDELGERAIEADVGDLRVKVIGYDDLIRIKRAAGRPHDLADIAALEDARGPAAT